MSLNTLWCICNSLPLMRPLFGNTHSVCIRGVATGRGYITYIYKQFVLQNCGYIRGVATGEGGHISANYCIGYLHK